MNITMRLVNMNETSLPPSCNPQVCQVSAQQPVQTELLMRHHQLQSRLATLRIENEEVRANVQTCSAGHKNGFKEGL